jgi:D-alanyl-D-alanine carboxypeptidase
MLRAMRRMLAASAAAVAVILAGMAAAARAQPTPGVPAALAALVATPGGPPGAAAIVHRGDQVVFHTAGVADVATGAPFRRTDYMRLASTSKAFNGAVALSLVRRHRLSLSDTIGQLLPYLPRAWRKVTLAEALNHTSGLPSYTKDESFRKFVVHHPHERVRPRRLLTFVANKPLEFKPGSSYEYSNSDNVVVGLMVAKATGHSYLYELRRRVLRPLGLRHTSLPAGAKLPSPYIRGYDVSEPRPEDVTHALAMSTAWAAGGMVSSPGDLDRFIRADVGGAFAGQRLSRRQLRVVRGASEPPGPGRNAAGLAIFRYRTPCGTVFGHTGNTLGYTQFAAATRDGRRSVTVSVNTQLAPGAGSQRAFRALRHAELVAVCAALR